MESKRPRFCDFPRRGALDKSEELQDDEDTVDDTPWCQEDEDPVDDEGHSSPEAAHEGGDALTVAEQGSTCGGAAPPGNYGTLQ